MRKVVSSLGGVCFSSTITKEHQKAGLAPVTKQHVGSSSGTGGLLETPNMWQNQNGNAVRFSGDDIWR
jgi:hypothetical protein